MTKAKHGLETYREMGQLLENGCEKSALRFVGSLFCALSCSARSPSPQENVIKGGPSCASGMCIQPARREHRVRAGTGRGAGSLVLTRPS